MKKRLVIVETPYAGEVERNTMFARACMLDCLKRGEAPFLSHLLYTQCLDDTKTEDRTLGIEAGLAWGALADATIVYTDMGISRGMRLGMDRARSEGRRIEFRKLYAVNPAHWSETDNDP